MVVRDRKEKSLSVSLPKEDRSSKEADFGPEARQRLHQAIKAGKDQLKALVTTAERASPNGGWSH